MEALGLTAEMVAVLGLLGITVFLFASEIVRVDVAAIIVLVALGLFSYVPGFENLVDPSSLTTKSSHAAIKCRSMKR